MKKYISLLSIVLLYGSMSAMETELEPLHDISTHFAQLHLDETGRQGIEIKEMNTQEREKDLADPQIETEKNIFAELLVNEHEFTDKMRARVDVEKARIRKGTNPEIEAEIMALQRELLEIDQKEKDLADQIWRERIEYLSSLSYSCLDELIAQKLVSKEELFVMKVLKRKVRVEFMIQMEG